MKTEPPHDSFAAYQRHIRAQLGTLTPSQRLAVCVWSARLALRKHADALEAAGVDQDRIHHIVRCLICCVCDARFLSQDELGALRHAIDEATSGAFESYRTDAITLELASCLEQCVFCGYNGSVDAAAGALEHLINIADFLSAPNDLDSFFSKKTLIEERRLQERILQAVRSVTLPCDLEDAFIWHDPPVVDA